MGYFSSAVVRPCVIGFEADEVLPVFVGFFTLSGLFIYFEVTIFLGVVEDIHCFHCSCDKGILLNIIAIFYNK